MEAEKPQPITWRQLEAFAASVPEDQKDSVAHIVVEDSSKATPLLEPFFMHEDIYSNKDEAEDSGPLEDLKYAHGENFDLSDYELVTPKGTPFLWTE